jgi:hypothetical protein
MQIISQRLRHIQLPKIPEFIKNKDIYKLKVVIVIKVAILHYIKQFQVLFRGIKLGACNAIKSTF